MESLNEFVQASLASPLLAKHPSRARLPFRDVNRKGRRDYQPGMQRHHLLPRQLLSQGCFSAFLEVLGTDRIGFDDFRLNGLLLPARDGVAARLRLPLHRGPHATYNALVAMRVGRIERDWSARRLRWPASARQDAIMRLRLLQGALRRRLLAPDRPQVRLNRHQTIVAGVDFTELDALADVLWADAGATT